MYDHERSLVKKLEDLPFALVGVNSDRDLDAIRETVKEKNLTWRSFQNSPEGADESISDQWHIEGWPTIYILDAEGKIRYVNPQRSSDGTGDLDKAILALLAEMGHEVDLTHEEEADDADSKEEDADSEDTDADSDEDDEDKAEEDDSDEDDSDEDNSDEDDSDDADSESDDEDVPTEKEGDGN